MGAEKGGAPTLFSVLALTKKKMGGGTELSLAAGRERGGRGRGEGGEGTELPLTVGLCQCFCTLPAPVVSSDQQFERGMRGQQLCNFFMPENGGHFHRQRREIKWPRRGLCEQDGRHQDCATSAIIKWERK